MLSGFWIGKDPSCGWAGMNKEVILLSMRWARIHVNLTWFGKGRILKAAGEKFCQMLKQFSRLARFQLWDWEPFANWAQEVEPCRGAEPKQSKKKLQEFWRLPSVTIFCEEPGGGIWEYKSFRFKPPNLICVFKVLRVYHIIFSDNKEDNNKYWLGLSQWVNVCLIGRA